MESTSNVQSAPFADIAYHKYPEKYKQLHTGDKIVPSNFYQRGKLGIKKNINAWTTYTAKGFAGSKDANFYEFLSMGSIPYVLGSLTMIALPNALNHFLPTKDKCSAKRFGLKAGLGVIFYGLAKHFSKRLVEEPVKWTTGVDLNLPYVKYSHELPTLTNNDPVRKEGHFVYESVEFARTDKLADYEGGEKTANRRFDKIAKKLGYECELVDSDQIVKPKIREITTKTKTVTYFTQYFWAALAVAYAFQKPWDRLISKDEGRPLFTNNKEETISNLKNKLKQLSKKSTWKEFGSVLKDSAVDLYKGGLMPNKPDKYSGKILTLGTIGLTALGTIWTIVSSQQKDKPVSDRYMIDKKKEYTVT